MHRKTQQVDQRGVVSLMVTLIMMLVISLIVIGFTQATMRSRREALDKQLSSQAFYAAESGVNKAVAKINLHLNDPVNIVEKDDCANHATDTYNAFPLDGTNVAVTCIMVNKRPKSIVGEATQSSSFVTSIRPINVTNPGSPSVKELTFSWAPPDGTTGVGSNCSRPLGKFEPTLTTCAFGLLRVDMLQYNDAASDSPAVANTSTFYMQPQQNGNPAADVADTINGTAGGKIIGATCSVDSTERCSAKLLLSGAIQTKKFYVRISSLYKDSKSVEITGTFVDNNPVYFDGAQAVIDATGRAQDVLRRVQVRYSLATSDDTPPWAAGGKACKRLTVVPGATPSVTNDATLTGCI